MSIKIELEKPHEKNMSNRLVDFGFCYTIYRK